MEENTEWASAADECAAIAYAEKCKKCEWTISSDECVTEETASPGSITYLVKCPKCQNVLFTDSM